METEIPSDVFITVLGTLQDGGAPHLGCKKDCCTRLFENPHADRKVVSLGLIDPKNNKKYLFEATPDIVTQLKTLKNYLPKNDSETPDGIFLTHAHIGHYTGLMYLGKEAANTNKVPVYAMPKMADFLNTNGPWSQLVQNNNIQLSPLQNEEGIALSPEITIRPILVPHRDEFSETVGYYIKGPNKTALFIPDIDKWEKWDKNILEEIKKVDYAFLDATFYSGEEINTRDISQIPHPFISESLKKFETLSKTEQQKVIFIHFNHTNPILDTESQATKNVLAKGFRVARICDVFEL
ncbi:MBL fold metallo-hydrolase [Cellulophaga sp. Hel_I_12]|uniref:MBL fold metallo-hydrolase n=1 Tax=Cellulophaga sp. Hel_I_12 TaxID=1249972 RepID=UPI001E2CE45F|nr:MBL fold metallo-hydrolase [Cellulophaga sp. Hel_I_12]